MNLTTDLMRYHKRINNWAKLGIIAVAALVAAPVVFVIIKGIVGLAVAALLGGTVIMVAPAVSMRIANTRLALKKREAMRAPIETMQESLRSVYRPARLSYSKLTTSPVATIATDALFLVQDYSGSAPMMEKLAALRNCAWEAIPSLQSTIGKHPKWRAVSPTNKGKWKWLEAAETPAAKAVPTKRK